MTKSQALAEYYGLTYRVIQRQLDGLTHEDSLLQLTTLLIKQEAKWLKPGSISIKFSPRGTIC